MPAQPSSEVKPTPRLLGLSLTLRAAPWLHGCMKAATGGPRRALWLACIALFLASSSARGLCLMPTNGKAAGRHDCCTGGFRAPTPPCCMNGVFADAAVLAAKMPMAAPLGVAWYESLQVARYDSVGTPTAISLHRAEPPPAVLRI